MTHRYNTRFQAKQNIASKYAVSPTVNEAEHIEYVTSEDAQLKANIKLIQSYLNKVEKTQPGTKERLEEGLSMMAYMCVSPLCWKTYPKFYVTVQTKIADLLNNQLPEQKLKWANQPDVLAVVYQFEMVTKLLDAKMKE
jgi:hypothetical protein